MDGKLSLHLNSPERNCDAHAWKRDVLLYLLLHSSTALSSRSSRCSERTHPVGLVELERIRRTKANFAILAGTRIDNDTRFMARSSVGLSINNLGPKNIHTVSSAEALPESYRKILYPSSAR